MTTYGAQNNSLKDNIAFCGFVAALLFLFVAMSQPVWRGEQMVAEYRDKCALAEGKMYERKSWLGGTVYECIGGKP